MVDVDRQDLLRSLDARHDDLVRQLELLNERIEQALAASGATTCSAWAPFAGGATADPGARSC
jgi:hypothetical protein